MVDNEAKTFAPAPACSWLLGVILWIAAYASGHRTRRAPRNLEVMVPLDQAWTTLAALPLRVEFL